MPVIKGARISIKDEFRFMSVYKEEKGGNQIQKVLLEKYDECNVVNRVCTCFQKSNAIVYYAILSMVWYGMI